MWISVAVTPCDVAPPLLPLNAMHGGEYGSPGTCRPLQVWTPAAVAPPPPPPPPAALPCAGVAPGWVDAVDEPPPPLPGPKPVPVSAGADALAVVVSGTFDGTSSAIS